jgi:uncharacterized damage-inducible protein DinB
MSHAERIEPPVSASEREMLTGWLDYHRATLELKCAGLTDEQLRQRAVPPSSLSLLGLVRHLAEVERSWFRRGLAGEDAPPSYYGDDNPDGDFDDVDTADVAEAFGTWRSEYQRARELVAAAPTLDVIFSGSTRQYTLRWLMCHMVEEYARHNGHADLLRERIDGSVGE